LEALHKAWSSRSSRIKYNLFTQALDDAAAKIADYYDKTASSDAFLLSMGRLWYPVLLTRNTDLLFVYSAAPRNEDEALHKILAH
jgi:hypothetical protein